MKLLISILLVSFFTLVDSLAQNNVIIPVSGACGLCRIRIEKIALKMSSVKVAEYDVAKQQLLLKTGNGFERKKLVDALLKAGHDADGRKAPDDIYNKLHECCHYRESIDSTMDDHTHNQNLKNDQNTEEPDESQPTGMVVKVLGICDMCKDRIESTALNVIGVQTALYNIDRQELTITAQEMFKKSELIEALVAVGHDAGGLKAPDDIYNSLPAFCHYRNTPVLISSRVQKVEGVVLEYDEKTKLELAVAGALVMSFDGVQKTLTEVDGSFAIDVPLDDHQLIIQFIGYSTDTVHIAHQGPTKIIISTEPLILKGVEIIYRKKPTEVSFLDPIKTQKISSKELLKAACCSLAESFDTTPAIDASTTDAVTGTRKIEMLGLAGPYVQITRENIPEVRGLAAIQGLSYTPGAWIESMQLNMGAGSVVNGFESITGQINIELLKPCHDQEMYLNAYAGQSGRFEANSFQRQKLNERWSTANLIHLSTRVQRRDHNHDGFLDIPLGKQLGFVNRWKWTNNNGQEGQVGMKISYLDNISGQNDFDRNTSDRYKIWGSEMTTQRAEVWAKRGFVNLDSPYKTLGFQVSGVYHDQKSQFGIRRYDATQKSAYFNMIYQTIIANTDHQVRMGTSTQWDQYHEIVSGEEYHRNEVVPGIFGEYTFKGSQKYTILVGGRADYHNNYGLFFTPRLNIRYAPTENTVFRLAAGRGQRTQSIFAENIGVFASNRDIIIRSDGSTNPYGLRPEIAWNMGASMTQDFRIGKLPFFLSIDANRVEFINQIVLDLDESPQKAVFYNLTGQSYANSIQTLLEASPTKWVDVRLAYRYNDVRTTFGEKLLRKPLTSPSRSFLNTAFHLGKGWSIDYTINYLTSVRIPSTAGNPISYRWQNQSPSYFLSNAQISKSYKNGFEWYMGGENIFDYRLHEPIISSSQPFGTYFDASLAWGPIMGINLYVGVRYSLKEKLD